jgi:hypothetical protein
MLNRPRLAGTDVMRMKSLLKVVQSEMGARVSWDVVGCSDYPEHLADKLEEVHEGALLEAEARIREAGAEEAAEEVPSVDSSLVLQVMEQVMDSVSMA